MRRNQKLVSLVLFSAAVSLGLLTTPHLLRPFPVLAESPRANDRIDGALSVNFEPRPEEGAPDRTVGAGSRGGCQTEDQNPDLTFVSPSKSQLTIDSHPTFFVYFPPTHAKTAEFVLSDENRHELYSTTLNLKGVPGIVRIQYPQDKPPLNVGEKYRLYVGIICSSDNLDANPFAMGSVERTEPSGKIMDQLKAEPPLTLKRAALYGQDGIWYDTVAILAALRQSQPENISLTTTWEQLLKSVGLDEIATKPLLDVEGR